MSATVLAPLASPPLSGPTPTVVPVWPRPLRWSVADFHRAGELGLFEGKRPILIDGVILEQGPMKGPHALAVEKLMYALIALFPRPNWRVRIQLPFIFDLFTDLFPDASVIAGGWENVTGNPSSASLIVEVSDTTLAFDTGENLRLYALAGIPEYWVVDLVNRQLLVYRDPRAGIYRDQQVIDENGSVSPLAAPAATVNVADLLP